MGLPDYGGDQEGQLPAVPHPKGLCRNRPGTYEDDNLHLRPTRGRIRLYHLSATPPAGHIGT